MSSHEVKPQSIVHLIGRLGSKITKPISRRRNRLRMQRKLAESLTKFSVQSVTLHESATSSISFDYSMTFDGTSLGDYESLEDSENTCSFLEGLFEEDDEIEEQDLFETLDQNELLSECFMSNQQSDVLFLVHFSNQESSISKDLEGVLSTHILESKSKWCECRRIDSKRAPLLTAKLHIDPGQPTVVAIKNGKVLSKVSGTEVNHWLTRSRILQTKNEPIDTFSGVCTYMRIDHSGHLSIG